MRFSRKTLGIPYGVFLLLFVVAPLLVLFFYAFTNGQGRFTLQNLTEFFTDPNTLGTLAYSLAIATVTTLLCLLIAYPVAFILATSKLKAKSVIIMIFVMPMWINFSLRITALKEINQVLQGELSLSVRKRVVKEHQQRRDHKQQQEHAVRDTQRFSGKSHVLLLTSSR